MTPPPTSAVPSERDAARPGTAKPRLARPLGLALALVVAAATMALQYRSNRVYLQQFDLNSLPAFDPYVYVAMAEHPSVFTVAPWGYRLLTPLLVRVWPARTDHAYRQLTLAALTASGALLFLFLRRLGLGLARCLAAVAVFGLSPPVAEVTHNPFLTEPVSVLLEVGFLAALEAGGGTGTLAFLLLLAALCKELLLVLLLPVLYFAWRPRHGSRAALASCVTAAAPALALSLILRWGWTPYLPPRGAELGPDILAIAVERLARFAKQVEDIWLLAGLTLLATMGALRIGGRPYLRRYGWLVGSSVTLPFVAWAGVPGMLTPFFGTNVLRLLVYALPPLLPLALAGLGSSPAPDAAPVARRTRSEALAVAAAWAVALTIPWALDHYRRLDLRGVRDGPLVLVLCRESLKVAQQLQAGQRVSWAPAELGYLESEAEYHEIKKLRWFLREGWGPSPQYGYGPVAMQADSSSFLLPCFADRDLSLTLALSAPRSTVLRVEVNGVPLGEVGVRPEPSAAILHVPRSILFRGDNTVVLRQAAPAGPGPRLDRITLEPLPPRQVR